MDEDRIDDPLDDPYLATPPIVIHPEKPKPVHVRRPKVFKIAPKFPLLTKKFYKGWVKHQKEVYMAQPMIDNKPPALYPENYLKPRRLNVYTRQLEVNSRVNKDLLKRISLIQRGGGYVDSWMHDTGIQNMRKLVCKRRQTRLDEIRERNLDLYARLLVARSEQPSTQECREFWEYIKLKLIQGASLPFILFQTGSIDKGFRDPAFDAPPNVYRPRVAMEVWVRGGSKIGRVIIELFTDICPITCNYFLNLIKGESRGYAYSGTRIFRIVPELYCCGGDVCKDNGFGCYLRKGEHNPMAAENHILKHTVPGVVSMAITADNEMCGYFNFIFKPLPQFDGTHVVFGRIVSGPVQFLDRISILGLPLGGTYADVYIRTCGWYSRSGVYHEGNPNTIKFPKRRSAKLC